MKIKKNLHEAISYSKSNIFFFNNFIFISNSHLENYFSYQFSATMHSRMHNIFDFINAFIKLKIDAFFSLWIVISSDERFIFSPFVLAIF